MKRIFRECCSPWGDGLARIRQTTEVQQQVAYRLAHHCGLPPVPYGGQTYRPWQDREPAAQVADRQSRSGFKKVLNLKNNDFIDTNLIVIVYVSKSELESHQSGAFPFL